MLNLRPLLCWTLHPSTYKMFHQHASLLFCSGGESQVVLIYISWGRNEALGFPRQPLRCVARKPAWRPRVEKWFDEETKFPAFTFILEWNKCFQQWKCFNFLHHLTNLDTWYVSNTVMLMTTGCGFNLVRRCSQLVTLASCWPFHSKIFLFLLSMYFFHLKHQ